MGHTAFYVKRRAIMGTEAAAIAAAASRCLEGNAIACSQSIARGTVIA